VVAEESIDLVDSEPSSNSPVQRDVEIAEQRVDRCSIEAQPRAAVHDAPHNCTSPQRASGAGRGRRGSTRRHPSRSAPRSDARGDPDVLLFGMTTTTLRVRGRGTLTLPAALREKSRLDEGDPLTVVDLDGAVLLSPRVLVVPRLAAEMERLRRARKLSLKDLGGPARED
jgi:bifunctional DNA-binding transcriptional regulator/antitoxin component of YhaV-PrlF toxin-antitoxin module